MLIESIESRFKEVTGLTHLDLSVRHFEKSDNQQQKTTKSEYRNFGFVATPLWLVDEMLEPQIPSLIANFRFAPKTCDACSGCGQFSIRLLRKLYWKLVDAGVDSQKADKVLVGHWLKNCHWFTEFQFSNVAKLIYIFGTNINVYVGDSLNMKYASDNENDEYGLLFFNEKMKKWINIPKLQSEIEKRKDNLSDLITLLGCLETTWNRINAIKH